MHEQQGQLAGWRGPGKQVALAGVAAHRHRPLQLRFRFNAFRRYLHAERVTERRDGLDNLTALSPSRIRTMKVRSIVRLCIVISRG